MPNNQAFFLVKSIALVGRIFVIILLRYEKGTTINKVTVQPCLYLFPNHSKHFHYSNNWGKFQDRQLL